MTPRVHIDGVVWHLDVGSSHPGAGAGPKGLAVRQLKRRKPASFSQNIALSRPGGYGGAAAPVPIPNTA
ncbi:hypothetical protein Lal_00001513 [Lupinus albus]|nr:hypothetical protein Lal_00001513 [Lupinus albus]